MHAKDEKHGLSPYEAPAFAIKQRSARSSSFGRKSSHSPWIEEILLPSTLSDHDDHLLLDFFTKLRIGSARSQYQHHRVDIRHHLKAWLEDGKGAKAMPVDEYQRVKICVKDQKGMVSLFELSDFDVQRQSSRYAVHVASLDPAGLKIGANVLKSHDLQTLYPRTWLNDLVINSFCQACAAATAGRCVFMHSILVPKLRQGEAGVRAAKKWMRKAAGYDASKVIFPIHVNGNHWAVGVFAVSEKVVEYYDSMQQSPRADSELVALLLGATTQIFDESGPWRFANSIPKVPQQKNFYDCGVFACRFFHSLCAGCTDFDFGQADMDASRVRIGLALLALAGVSAL